MLDAVRGTRGPEKCGYTFILLADLSVFISTAREFLHFLTDPVMSPGLL